MNVMRLMACSACVVGLLMLTAGRNAMAQETCGLQAVVYDVIFADPFEPTNGTLGVPLGTVPAPTTGVAPVVTVTYPVSNATLSANHTAVAGTFTGPDHTGIMVNGQLGYTLNNAFLVPDVPVDAIDPTLHATATTLDDLNNSTSVAVQLPAQAALARLDADASAGLAPFAIDFSVSVDSSRQVQGIVVTFGDGGSYSGASTTGIPTHTYATPGLYTAMVTVSTTTGSLSAEHRVAILDVQQLRNRVCGVYAHLRAKLNAQDSTHALQAYDAVDRHRYQNFFTALGQPQLPSLAAELGTIAAGMVGPHEAHMTVVKVIAGVIQGYPIEFATDENGVWRIRQM